METLIRAQLENQYGINRMRANSIRWLKVFFALSLMANVGMFLALSRAYGEIAGLKLIGG